MLGLGGILQGAAGQLLLGNHNLRFPGDIADGKILDGDVGIAILMELLAQGCCTQGAGAHACVAGVSDEVEFLAADLLLSSLALAGGLHGCHAGLSIFQRFFFVSILGHLDEGRSHYEGNDGSYYHVCDIGQESSFRSHSQNSDDGTGRRRSNEAAVQRPHGEHAAHAAGDDCQHQLGLHEDVGEIDLVDTAQEVDDHSTGRRSLGHALAHEPVSQEDAQAGAGVGFDEEEHGLAEFLGLLDAQRREDAVVDGVVEEENLGRLHQDGNQRQQAHAHNGLNAGAQDIVDRQHHGAYGHIGQDGQDAAQDAGGEVVHQHLEAAGDGILHSAVKLLDEIAAHRAHDHGAQEHGDVGTGDDTAGGNGAHHAAAVAVDRCAAGEAQEQGDQPLAHGAAHLGQVLIGHPARGDEQGCQKAPGDEGADVRHDHARQEPTKLLHGFLGAAGFCACTHFSKPPN